MAGDQRIPALVKKYGFTPREFMLANIALTNAILAVQARNDPALANNLNPVWVNRATSVSSTHIRPKSRR